MTLTEQIYAQALLLAGELEQRQTELLKVLCQGANNALAGRLRDGLTPEDCKADFIAAASLFALSALSAADEIPRWKCSRQVICPSAAEGAMRLPTA